MEFFPANNDIIVKTFNEQLFGETADFILANFVWRHYRLDLQDDHQGPLDTEWMEFDD